MKDDYYESKSVTQNLFERIPFLYIPPRNKSTIDGYLSQIFSINIMRLEQFYSFSTVNSNNAIFCTLSPKKHKIEDSRTL